MAERGKLAIRMLHDRLLVSLDDEAGGIEIEFMQVYTPEQLKEYEDFKGI